MGLKFSQWLYDTALASLRYVGAIIAFTLWGLVYAFFVTRGWDHWAITLLLFFGGFKTGQYFSSLIGAQILRYRVLTCTQQVSSTIVNARIFPSVVEGVLSYQRAFLFALPRKGPALIRGEDFAFARANYTITKPYSEIPH
jgi:hypothetical protein